MVCVKKQVLNPARFFSLNNDGSCYTATLTRFQPLGPDSDAVGLHGARARFTGRWRYHACQCKPLEQGVPAIPLSNGIDCECFLPCHWGVLPSLQFLHLLAQCTDYLQQLLVGLAKQQLLLISVLPPLCRKDDPTQPRYPSVALLVVRVLSWSVSGSVTVPKRHLEGIEVTTLSGVLPLLSDAVVLWAHVLVSLL